MPKLQLIIRTLLVCLAASIAASFLAVLISHDFGNLVWETLAISFFYSTGIAFVVRALVPPVVRWMGNPGWKLTVVLSLTLIVSAAIGSFAGGVLLLALGFGTAQQFWANYFFLVRIAAALAVVSGLGSYFYENLTSQLREARAQLKEKEIEQERAEKNVLEAKLSSLESRIHPHFLFNTLNSISALIPVDHRQAEEMVGRLSRLLRASLNSAQEGLISLESEIALVTNYIEIEKARLGERLQYSFDIAEGTFGRKVPPFAVQSLVENAIKYGIAAEEHYGKVEIAASLSNDCLRLEIRDTGPGFDLSQVQPGHGLDNLVSRLDALFGPRARLEVERQDNLCVVTLLLPV